MRVLGVSGSLRRDSLNRRLLRAAGDLLPPGVELVEWDGLKAVAPFDEDDEDGPAPPGVAELREAIASADAVLFVTPEYNGSIPGQLKNAVDWASRPTSRRARSSAAGSRSSAPARVCSAPSGRKPSCARRSARGRARARPRAPRGLRRRGLHRRRRAGRPGPRGGAERPPGRACDGAPAGGHRRLTPRPRRAGRPRTWLVEGGRGRTVWGLGPHQLSHSASEPEGASAPWVTGVRRPTGTQLRSPGGGRSGRHAGARRKGGAPSPPSGGGLGERRLRLLDRSQARRTPTKTPMERAASSRGEAPRTPRWRVATVEPSPPRATRVAARALPESRTRPQQRREQRP